MRAGVKEEGNPGGRKKKARAADTTLTPPRGMRGGRPTLRTRCAMGKLSGKVAIVTGASRGIGAAIAKRFAADGAKVIVNYAKSAQAAAEVVAEIKKAGGEAVAVKADVG